MPAEVIQLRNARMQVEERPGYLYLIESGTLKTVQEVDEYAAALEAIIQRTGIARAIIDARDELGSEAAPDVVRNAMWDWLAAPGRGFQMVAFILPSEMAVARVNMTALSRRALVRAFDSVQQAQRWLIRGPRQSSMSLPSIAPMPPSGVRPGERTPSSHPPPPERERRVSSSPPAADSLKHKSEVRPRGEGGGDRGNNGGSQVA